MEDRKGCQMCTDPNCPGPTGDPDDPHWDGTDFAHPAWWRAHDHTVKMLCQHINAVLDDPGRADRGHGASPWHETRQRIANMVRDGNRVARKVEDLMIEVMRLRQIVNGAVGEDLRRQMEERMRIVDGLAEAAEDAANKHTFPRR